MKRFSLALVGWLTSFAVCMTAAACVSHVLGAAAGAVAIAAAVLGGVDAEREERWLTSAYLVGFAVGGGLAVLFCVSYAFTL